MKLLYFTKYSRKGASSRLRSFQYFDSLKEAGIQVEVQPLFDDLYLSQLYAGKQNRSHVISRYLKRFFFLFKVYKYDVVVIEKELFPYFPSFFEYLLKMIGKKFIVDYDDAIFHNYDSHPNMWIRKLLGNKIDKVMHYSNLVIAGNEYLAKRALKAGSKNVEIIPTVIDVTRYSRAVSNVNNPFVIGWIGTKSTFKYLAQLKPVLKNISLKHDIMLHVIGSEDSLGLPEIEKNIKWTESTEVDSIKQFSVGVMPLQDSQWELGKCSYKLIQYMGCGIPVIASPVGMNNQVVTEGINGFLAATNEEWYNAIEQLILNKDLRARLGANGFEKVQEFYNLDLTSRHWIACIKSV